jgi:RNA polymerase sigma-70 factor, ECF subfamily
MTNPMRSRVMWNEPLNRPLRRRTSPSARALRAAGLWCVPARVRCGQRQPLGRGKSGLIHARQPTSLLVTPAQAVQHARDLAFEREAIPRLDDVYRFALSLTRDESDAHDVAQETFLRAYRSWHTYVPGSDCRRWMFTICRNVFLRSRERERVTVDIDDIERDVIGTGEVYAAAIEQGYTDLFARLDILPAIEEAIDALPEPFRSTVVIVDVEDQPYDAAAEILGVPIGTVRSRLFRGRRMLQERLMAHASDVGLAPKNPRAAGAT